MSDSLYPEMLTSQELGDRLTPPKVAKLMKMSVRRVMRCYAELGGFILGGRIYFYEESIRHAIQNKIKQSMDGAGDDGRKESKPTPLQNEKRSPGMGKRGKEKDTDWISDSKGRDLFDLTSGLGNGISAIQQKAAR